MIEVKDFKGDIFGGKRGTGIVVGRGEREKIVPERGKDMAYVVEFEGGIRPQALIYAVDGDDVELYMLTVAARVEAGKQIKEVDGNAILCDGYGVNLTYFVSGSTGCFNDIFRREGDSCDLENRLLLSIKRICENGGVNAIWVSKPGFVRDVVDWHVERYKEQFSELAKDIEGVFNRLLEKHEALGYYPSTKPIETESTGGKNGLV